MKVTHPMSKVKYILHWLRRAKKVLHSERSDHSSFFISAKPSRFTPKYFHQHLIDVVNRFEFHSL